MVQNVHCISLRVVKHNDTTSIVTAWSAELGRISFAVPSGTGREAQRRRALMMPFSMFEGVANVRVGGGLARISGVRSYGVGNVSAVDPIKNIVSMFLADFLYAVLRESESDEHLTSYIFESVRALGASTGTSLANFPLSFIYRLSHFLGIAPDTGTYMRHSYFDMREGRFSLTAPLHHNVLQPADARIIMILAEADFGQLHHLKLNRHARKDVLDRMLEYYTMHHAAVSQISSLQVLRSVLG